MNAPQESRFFPGAVLLHPLVLGSLVLWFANDHVFKPFHPCWLTGKLSDVTSLIVFPLLALAVVEMHGVSSRRARTCWLLVCVSATGLVMATINLFEPAAFAYRWGLGTAQWPLRATRVLFGDALPAVQPVQLTMDAGDLMTLPALLVPLFLAWPRQRRSRD